MKNLFQLEIERVHALGFAIIMIKPKDKRPVDSNWTSGPRKTLAAILKQYQPGMNIGVRLGEASKLSNGKYLAVIDCDLKSNEKIDLDAMHSRLDEIFPEWRKSPIVKSGRGNGSMHIYVSVKTPLKKINLHRSEKMVSAFMGSDSKPSQRDIQTLSKDELDKGYRLRPAFELDFLCSGQQCLLPPSIHPLTGKPYDWSRILNRAEDLVDAHFIKYDMQPKALGKTGIPLKSGQSKFQFEIQNIALEFESRISDKYKNLIINGEGIEDYKDDRTNALMACALHMVKVGLSSDEILTLLTDKDYYLGVVAYEHRKTNDRHNAAEWLNRYTLKKAITMLNDQAAFDDEVEFIDYEGMSKEDKEKTQAEAKEFFEAEVKPLSDWRALLQCSQNGNYKKTTFNLELILKNKMIETGSGIFFDAFYGTEYIYGPCPWRDDITSAEPREVVDYDLIAIASWISAKYKLEFSKEAAANALIRLGGNDRRHSIKDYLNTCEWDGKPRLNSWLKDYMRSKDKEPYLSVVGRSLIKALIYRVFQPGCQFDQVVIFQGGQGVGKSSAMRILGGTWFTDNLGRIGDKDTLLILHRHWLIEVAELDSMTKADTEHFKQFVSSQVDAFRKPFDRKSQSYKRQCVLVGTTNREEYLRDETGNRRFWPVSVGTVDIEGLRSVRDQLMAEAMHAYKNGEALWSGVDDAFKAELAELHNDKMISDEIEEEVLKALAILEENSEFKSFTISEIWRQMEPLSGGSVPRMPETFSRKIGKILRKHDYRQKSFRPPGSKKTLKKWCKDEKSLSVPSKNSDLSLSGNTEVTDVGF